MKEHALRQIQDISALLNSSLDTATIRQHAIEAATVLLNAEAGSLLLLDEAAGELYFDVAYGDKGSAVRASRIKLGQGIAGYVGRTKQPVIVHDVQHDARFFRHVDQASGYITRNMVCVPVTAHGRLLGVLQAINRKDGDSFDEEALQVFVAFGHQVGIAIENANLYEEIQVLFEGFISASVQAIESRDPATSGHSQRVALLTCRLAEAVSCDDTEMYAAVRFTSDQIKELRYAAVLHDFGKVGIREPILLKARKLYPLEQELIRSRFDFIKRTMEADTLRRKLDIYETTGKASTLFAELDRQLAERIREVDEMFSYILECNEPDAQPFAQMKRLKKISQQQYCSYEGPRPYLTEAETEALAVIRGSLTPAEQREVERHVIHTYEFLSKIPWTRALKQVPEIAGAHHEKLDGSGYPHGLSGNRIPLQTRMMTICDIYDALTASDRPYKTATSSDIALGYLHNQAKEGKLDAGLVGLFMQKQIYQATQHPSLIRKAV